MTRPSELEFENHFCHQLELPFESSKMVFSKRKTENVDLDFLVDDELLTEFLEKTQKDELIELKTDAGKEWRSVFKDKLKKDLNERFLFEIIRDGIEVKGRHFKLSYFKPETTHNKDQWKRYEANRFTYVRQFAFNRTMESIDVVLFMNGLAIATIELKNKQTGQNVNDAVSQYVNRNQSLPIFKIPFFHLAVDPVEARLAARFVQKSADDFMPFNRDVENTKSIAKEDYPVDYLYHDVLRPESLIDLIESFLFSFEEEKEGKKIKTFLFPRYHQRRVVEKLNDDLRKHASNEKKLDRKYLIQHSAGSGKSYTIAVMQKILRNAHAHDSKIFDSIIIVTDRLNLDDQLKGTVEGSEQQSEIIKHADDSAKLAEYLNQDTKVIISTIQKFSVKKLDSILKSQVNKKICFIIDEAHRSQTGKLHRAMVSKFEDAEDKDYQEEILEGFSKRKYPNAVFIALTATPSDKTLSLFGSVFDSYSMDQAEKEGYILNVISNVISYSTLAKLSQELDNPQEYPAIVVSKKLKARIFEDDKIISDKCDRILKVFEKQTKNEIHGKSKTMVVTNSRLAAVKYKQTLDRLLQERKLPYYTLVAFSGTVNFQENSYTEKNMNKIDEKIEKEFNKSPYRFIIVANKFQYGFNQPLLQTMFLDKNVSGSNAVQTISRLNRIALGKEKTLVVDFTNSYKAIIAAFRKYSQTASDNSNIDPTSLTKLKELILSEGIFTKKDVEEYVAAYYSDNPSETTRVLSKVNDKLRPLTSDEKREFQGLLFRFVNAFKYLDNLFKINDQEMVNFALFVGYLARFIDPVGKGGGLDEEIKKIQVIEHTIKKQKQSVTPETVKIKRAGPANPPQYRTIPEVIEAINANYDIALGAKDKNLLETYLQSILKDNELMEEIKSNKANLTNFYNEVLARELKDRAINFFLANDPSKLYDYLQKDVLTELNMEAFRHCVKSI